LANMSHELRTPLNGILGYAQILKRDRALNRAQQDGVEIIQRGGEHLLTLITDLLDLARIEADRLDLEEGVFHLPTFLKDIGEMIGVRAERKGVTLVSEALSDLPEYVQGDERRLRQVLINLLGNAVKFTEEGEVFLKVTDLNGDQLRFEVLDTGVGISADKLKDIFKPFEQVGKRGKRIEGTGLGLAISHQLVGLMGGTLQVESKVGKGSRFWFSVALSEVEGSQEGVQKIEQTPVGFRGDVKKVLVVDDREENRLVLIDVLKPLGFEVDEACDGSEGLTKAEAWQPDLILMDLVMPEMDGFEAVGRIRQLDAFRDTTVFALSASVFEHDQKRSLEEGFDDFISKPVRVGELLGKMASHTALEWVYEERTPEVMANGEMQAPPPESLGSLFELAQKGRIVGVREEIDQIGGMGEEYEVFAEKLREMARGFKLREMCAFLESYLEETT
jgi:CheY-like chemotaxis protein